MSCIFRFPIHRPQRCMGSAFEGRSCLVSSTLCRPGAAESAAGGALRGGSRLVSSANRVSPRRNASFPATPSRRDTVPGNTRDSSDTSFFGPGFFWFSYIPCAHRLFVVSQSEHPEQRTGHRKDTSFPMTPPFWHSLRSHCRLVSTASFLKDLLE